MVVAAGAVGIDHRGGGGGRGSGGGGSGDGGRGRGQSLIATLPPTRAAAAATTVEAAAAVLVTSCASVATAASVALISGPVRPAPVATVHGLGGAGVGLARVRAAPYYLYCIYSATVSTVIQSCTRTFGRGKVRAANLAGAGSNLSH